MLLSSKFPNERCSTRLLVPLLKATFSKQKISLTHDMHVSALLNSERLIIARLSAVPRVHVRTSHIQITVTNLSYPDESTVCLQSLDGSFLHLVRATLPGSSRPVPSPQSTEVNGQQPLADWV